MATAQPKTMLKSTAGIPPPCSAAPLCNFAPPPPSFMPLVPSVFIWSRGILENILRAYRISANSTVPFALLFGGPRKLPTVICTRIQFTRKSTLTPRATCNGVCRYCRRLMGSSAPSTGSRWRSTPQKSGPALWSWAIRPPCCPSGNHVSRRGSPSGGCPTFDLRSPSAKNLGFREFGASRILIPNGGNIHVRITLYYFCRKIKFCFKGS